MNQNLAYQTKKRIRHDPGNNRFWAAVTALAAFAACFLFACAAVTPKRYEINAGDIAQATITAPRDIVDRVTTREMQQKAAGEVKPVYKQDRRATQECLQRIAGFFEKVESIRAACETAFFGEMLSDTDAERWKQDFDPGKTDWDAFLTEKRLASVKESAGDTAEGFSEAEIKLFAAMKKQTLLDLQMAVTKLAEDELDIGVKEENADEQKLRLNAQIMANASYSENERKIAAMALSLVAPNLFYDEEAMERERNNAADNVLPAVYKKGQNIVQEGEMVTEAQIQVLRDLGLKQENTFNYSLYAGVFIYMLLCFSLFGAWTAVFDRGMLRSMKSVLLAAIIVVAVSGMAVPLNKIEPRIVTVFLGTILACILLTPKSAVGITVLLSLVTGLTSASGEGVISERMLVTILAGMFGGLTGVFFLRKAHHRTQYIYSGLAAGLVNAMVFAMAGLIRATGYETLLGDTMWAMISGAGGAVLAIGALPVLESVFRIATATKLLEILNPNQPLLRRLSLEAPGTYHHSMITANLAEAAAEELGLNTLLVKAAAYYHDIGKLKKPEMFKENQQALNPHDALEPKISADILREHVTCGKQLALRHKLPRELVELIGQHHGTAVMPYFYSRARESAPQTDIKDYRYKGPKPQSREAAVLMLADCVEAAVRASGTTQKDVIGQIIDKLIRERMEDAQFEECDITQRDLRRIAGAFLGVYQGMYHERIAYPGAEQNA